ncbi:MAG: Stk1 family PASTA domain-containing Ser/Thr kinase [Clostridia bacterium]|nr:Stk1 family PASTA domain-containing Ser/Thr kinase [Clostridia bacterium]
MDKYLGKRLDGRYEMRELIGVGGMAYVYKAYDNVDDRTVAVKILRDEFLTNEEFVRRFRNESKAIAILNHPNIVKVLDVGFGDRLQYIVMEYIDGISLKEYLDQRKDLRWKEAVHFTVQILRALQHAHDKGIVHRDIKPQNIMLLSDATIKVTDFGIARLTRSELRVTAVGDKAIGSVHYISPEQARGEITDEKADLYSVGIMLYEMLTGKLPFEADNAVSVAIMQMQSEPTLPHNINEDIPEGLEQITMKAMQKDASKRYQSAAEMLSDIDEFKRNPSIKFEYTYFPDQETPTRYVEAITRVRGNSPVAEEEPEETESTGKGRMSSIAILGIVAAAVMVAAVVFAILFSNMMSGRKKEIVVDDFIGKSYFDEVPVHENINNYNIKTESGYHADYPEGYVYNQDPAPGSKIKLKGDLTLYISIGARKATVPTMTPGEQATLVRSRLEKAGFKVVEVEESSLECKKGTVIRLTPEPGTEVKYGSEVTMYISSGEPTSDPIDMPDVTNIEMGSAIDMLVNAGFDRNKIKVEYVNYAAKKDIVVAMSPDHSLDQLPDVNIILTVSTGYQDVDLTVFLPDVKTAVDLKVYVNGTLDSTLTSQYQGILPQDKSSVSFAVNEMKPSYVVRVTISKAGENKFTDYVVFQINGETGEVESDQYYDFVDDSTTTTESTTTTTESTTTTTESTTTTTQPDDDQSAAGTTDNSEPTSSSDESDPTSSGDESDVSGGEFSDVPDEPSSPDTPDGSEPIEE